MTITDIENNGIIGAGGAGFPTHVKLNSKPDTVIMNAAECEPLLHKDMEIILHHSDEVLKGLESVMNITGAKEGIIGIKEKHTREIEILKSRAGRNIKVMPIEDFYPAGDEVTLIYMTTKRVVKAGELPASLDCIVQNVETLFNIGINKPVVEKFIAVAGAVENPATVKVPVGVSYADVLSQFKITAGDYVVMSGGLMMGIVEKDLNKAVSKRTGALIILPADHHCVTMYNRFATEHDTDLIAKAACDQCNYCTEFCPRYLIGQPVRPETAVRNRMFTREDQPMVFAGNYSCCECNLCTMYSCPEGLDPKGATVIEKVIARNQKLSWNNGKTSVHPMYDYRKVPVQKLKQRLDVLMFRDEGPLRDFNFNPGKVSIPLDQHIGEPATSLVAEGKKIKKCDLIGRAAGKVSANVHASIDGTVLRVTKKEIILKRN